MTYLRRFSERIWSYFSAFMNGSASLVNHLIWLLICLGIMSFLVGSLFVPLFGTGWYATMARRSVAFLSGITLYIVWILDDLNSVGSEDGG